jgi:hypothetical protein
MVNMANGKAHDPQNPEKHLKNQGGVQSPLHTHTHTMKTTTEVRIRAKMGG